MIKKTFLRPNLSFRNPKNILDDPLTIGIKDNNKKVISLSTLFYIENDLNIFIIVYG